MGNITGKQVGDFQANVGKASADIDVIVSYIIAGILILVAIGFAIVAFIPMKPNNCDDDYIHDTCDYPFNTSNEQQCIDKENKRCSKKKPNHMFLLFLILIPIAVIIVILARVWDHAVHTNRTIAQIGGTMAEVGMARDILGRN